MPNEHFTYAITMQKEYDILCQQAHIIRERLAKELLDHIEEFKKAQPDVSFDAWDQTPNGAIYKDKKVITANLFAINRFVADIKGCQTRKDEIKDHNNPANPILHKLPDIIVSTATKLDILIKAEQKLFQPEPKLETPVKEAKSPKAAKAVTYESFVDMQKTSGATSLDKLTASGQMHHKRFDTPATQKEAVNTYRQAIIANSSELTKGRKNDWLAQFCNWVKTKISGSLSTKKFVETAEEFVKAEPASTPSSPPPPR